MTRKWMGIAALLATCAWPNLALACSCMMREQAGFIHQGLLRLPANARGALFLPPTGDLRPIARYDGEVMIYSGAAATLTPSSFTIKSDSGSLEAQLTWLDLDLERDAQSGVPQRAFRFVHADDEKKFEGARAYPDWQPLLKAGKLIDISDELRAAARLLRVGPAGGFKPGGRYTITYLGNSAEWVYPAEVEHSIDLQPLSAQDLQYALVADGPPQRRLLSLSTGSGSCGSEQPAIVQDFHYQIADAARPYQHGILFFSEYAAISEASGTRRRFTQLGYQTSLCSRPRFGESALGMGRELMEVACETPGGRRSVRGWAGLLEVEDRLHRTDAIEIDFGQVSGRSCRGLGMLREALDAHDIRRVEAVACALGNEERREVPLKKVRWGAHGPLEAPLPPLTPQETPAAADLLALASDGNTDLRRCGRIAVTRLFAEQPVQNSDLPESFGKLLNADLASLEPARVDEAVALLRTLAPRQAQYDNTHGKARKLYRRVLLPVLPALVEALVSGQSKASAGMVDLLAYLGADGMDALLQGPLTATEKQGRASAIRAMNLPKAQKDVLLARLARVKARPQ